MPTLPPIRSAAIAVAAIGLAAGLAACNSSSINPSLNSVHKPGVSIERLAHSVRFEPDGSLSAAQALALEGFLKDNRVGYGDRLNIDDPNIIGQEARFAAIAAIVGKAGLLLDRTAAIPAGSAAAPGSVQLVVTRGQVVMPNCPDWRGGLDHEVTMSTRSNYGCAANRNLAAMVADPNDLQQGRTHSGVDAETITKAIDAWRQAPPSSQEGLQDVSATGD